MHTLFRSVTGGVDWGDMANLLIYVNWIWGHLLKLVLSGGKIPQDVVGVVRCCCLLH